MNNFKNITPSITSSKIVHDNKYGNIVEIKEEYNFWKFLPLFVKVIVFIFFLLILIVILVYIVNLLSDDPVVEIIQVNYGDAAKWMYLYERLKKKLKKSDDKKGWMEWGGIVGGIFVAGIMSEIVHNKYTSKKSKTEKDISIATENPKFAEESIKAIVLSPLSINESQLEEFEKDLKSSGSVKDKETANWIKKDITDDHGENESIFMTSYSNFSNDNIETILGDIEWNGNLDRDEITGNFVSILTDPDFKADYMDVKIKSGNGLPGQTFRDYMKGVRKNFYEGSTGIQILGIDKKDRVNQINESSSKKIEIMKGEFKICMEAQRIIESEASELTKMSNIKNAEKERIEDVQKTFKDHAEANERYNEDAKKKMSENLTDEGMKVVDDHFEKISPKT